MADFRLFLPDNGAIIGSVDERGILSFVVSAAPQSPIRGTEMFDLMMRAFGSRVRAIAGIWRRGFEGQKSTNIDRVNELTAQSIPLEEAVAKTWTATRAARWGYTKVTVVGVAVGVPGNYGKLDVLIEKGGPSV
jgi:hypothetical protein